MTTISSTKAPALPVADQTYTKSYQDKFANILRLYFNEIDNVTSFALGPLGAGYLDAPYIAASDSSDQFAPGNNTPILVRWDTADAINGFTLNPNGTATVSVAGVYKIDYSLQIANNDNAAHDVYVWLQENGTQIPKSSSHFTLPARKSASEPTLIVAYSSIVFVATPEDQIGLLWATDKAANSGGTINGIYLDYIPAQTTPYARPSSPSAIGSITFLSRL